MPSQHPITSGSLRRGAQTSVFFKADDYAAKVDDHRSTLSSAPQGKGNRRPGWPDLSHPDSVKCLFPFSPPHISFQPLVSNPFQVPPLNTRASQIHLLQEAPRPLPEAQALVLSLCSEAPPSTKHLPSIGTILDARDALPQEQTALTPCRHLCLPYAACVCSPFCPCCSAL